MKEKIAEMVEKRITKFIESSPYVLVGLFVASVVVEKFFKPKVQPE